MDVSIYTINIYTLILIFVSIIVLRNLMFFDFVNNLNHFNLNIINEDCCLKKKILLLNVCNAIYLLIFLKFNVFRSQFLLIFWFYNNIYTIVDVFCDFHIYCSKKKSEHNYYYYVAVLWFLYRYIDFVLFCLVQEKEKIDLYQFFYFYFFFLQNYKIIIHLCDF